jgi:hypothetical protein
MTSRPLVSRAGAWVVAGALALAAAPACGRAPTHDVPAPEVAPLAAPARPSVPAAPSTAAAPVEAPLVEEVPEGDPRSETVTIKLVADPARKAHVFWGRKDLGLAPLEVTRPRGSGPLDLVVVTPGALTLHTRVFTDRDDKLALHLYAEDAGPTLLGYRPDDVPDDAKPPPPGSKPSTMPTPKPAPKRPAPAPED